MEENTNNISGEFEDLIPSFLKGEILRRKK